ncbi:unnamed protein product [Prunus armeniaca]|uniref:Uncharacterized protein n=1 Tax=Prunus armeniaca TaxID=36596 RepID=A0A6J5WKC8_PRUAR|nr:unnamed protein product [Prunus armeniaca]
MPKGPCRTTRPVEKTERKLTKAIKHREPSRLLEGIAPSLAPRQPVPSYVSNPGGPNSKFTLRQLTRTQLQNAQDTPGSHPNVIKAPNTQPRRQGLTRRPKLNLPSRLNSQLQKTWLQKSKSTKFIIRLALPAQQPSRLVRNVLAEWKGPCRIN